MVGSVAVAAAASGALAMPHAVGSSDGSDGLNAVAQRPQEAGHPTEGGALDTLVAAEQSLAAETGEVAQEAHTRIVEQQRIEAAEEAARAERESKRWLLPVDNYRITAGFGAGGSMWSNRHTGLDFAAPTGTEVRTISSGEIIFAGYDGPYGNKIVVEHWDGTQTWYCHLSRFVLRSGEVAPGEVIGRVGSTGNSTGPHLHLEVHPGGGDPVNPRSWLQEQGVDV
ncbi:M23 family metallopeptidase [Jiangella muralis]|uniref:M23 family metallopeptidase n=1 Tax=Jiangella muralis TaxID=702383 RepID=UPI0012FB113A|nr:M23 family metallopeptidase [Jiangella muralis]